MTADHAHTDKGDEADNVLEISFRSCLPVSIGRGWHMVRGRGRSMCARQCFFFQNELIYFLDTLIL